MGSRFAYVSARSSAFCDEIVEVLGKLDNQDLVLIRNGAGLFWTPPKYLEPALPPVSCPWGLAVARDVYCNLLGAHPPPTARSGLVWAAVVRKLHDMGLSEPMLRRGRRHVRRRYSAEEADVRLSNAVERVRRKRTR